MTPLLATALAAFVLAALIQRKALFALRWAPTRDTGAALGAAVLPALFSALALLFPQDSLGFKLVLWLLIFGLCGFAIPWAYVLFVERSGPAALGIMRARWLASLSISALFAAGSLFAMLRRVDLAAYDPGHVAGAALHLNVGGLFELFLYCGFLHLRLRDAFGPLPAIVGSAALYSLWHIGTELPLHPDPAGALAMLFVVGLLTHALFATTYNLLVIWPVFFTVGVMHDFIVNLDLPDSIGTSLTWPLFGWVLAIGIPSALMLMRARACSRLAAASLLCAVMLAQTACAGTSQERRDYILAHPHGWVEVSLDDRAIPQVPSTDEDHPGLIRPQSCSLQVELDGEPFVYGSAFPIGDVPPYSAKTGFRFPAPIGAARMEVGYSGCDVDGDARATVEAEVPIVVEENRVTEVEFDGARLASLATRPNTVITLDDVYRAVTGKAKAP